MKLFRKIRQKSMAKNKTTTYLKYALGEVVLVVVGILIALQINNWNELRKERNREEKFLMSLKADLIVDMESLDNIMAHRKTKVVCANLLLRPQEIASRREVQRADSLIANLLGWMRFVPRTNTLDELISTGNLNIIGNDSIKSMLLALKEKHQEEDIYTEHMRREFDNYLYDRHSKLRQIAAFIDPEASFAAGSIARREPSDEEIALLSLQTNRFLSDMEVRNGLTLASMNNQAFLRKYKEMQTNVETLIGIIDKELQSK
jgi:hypothetical protein